MDVALRSIAPPAKEGVYFLQQLDRVKIGYSKNIKKRSRGDAFASHPIRLVAWVPGDLHRERALHEQFGELRVHGEWFRLEPALLEFIKAKQPKEKREVSPTKRQVASAIRRTARELENYPRMTAALFAVCSKHGGRASVYYDCAVRTIKAHSPGRFSDLLKLPVPVLQKRLRRAARALEHGLQIDV